MFGIGKLCSKRWLTVKPKRDEKAFRREHNRLSNTHFLLPGAMSFHSINFAVFTMSFYYLMFRSEIIERMCMSCLYVCANSKFIFDDNPEAEARS